MSIRFGKKIIDNDQYFTPVFTVLWNKTLPVIVIKI